MKGPRIPGDPSLFHILMGEPDEKCEICRAHALTGHDFPQVVPGITIIESGPLDAILRCPCPLCAQIDFERFEEDRDPDPDDPRHG
ncbi:MAG TPA: hypothetical protein VE981_07975 [Planctomycetota bacterium]|nr:hypothetical protein [Planctomycetota bacterium]